MKPKRPKRGKSGSETSLKPTEQIQYGGEVQAVRTRESQSDSVRHIGASGQNVASVPAQVSAVVAQPPKIPDLEKIKAKWKAQFAEWNFDKRDNEWNKEVPEAWDKMFSEIAEATAKDEKNNEECAIEDYKREFAQKDARIRVLEDELMRLKNEKS